MMDFSVLYDVRFTQRGTQMQRQRLANESWWSKNPKQRIVSTKGSQSADNKTGETQEQRQSKAPARNNEEPGTKSMKQGKWGRNMHEHNCGNSRAKQMNQSEEETLTLTHRGWLTNETQACIEKGWEWREKHDKGGYRLQKKTRNNQRKDSITWCRPFFFFFCPSSHHVFSRPSLTYCTSKVVRLDRVALKVDNTAALHSQPVCSCGRRTCSLNSSKSLLCASCGEKLPDKLKLHLREMLVRKWALMKSKFSQT